MAPPSWSLRMIFWQGRHFRACDLAQFVVSLTRQRTWSGADQQEEALDQVTPTRSQF